MPDLSTSWSYPLTEVTEDRRTRRTGVTRRGTAALLAGVDGKLGGGLKPHGGLLYVDQLPVSTTITGWFPIQMRVGTDRFLYGYVYRAEDSSTTSSVRVRYQLDGSLTWIDHTILAASASYKTPQMSVVVHGRFCYVCMEGIEPTLFYVNAALTAVNVTDTGPGAVIQAAVSEAPVDFGTWLPAAADYRLVLTTDNSLYAGADSLSKRQSGRYAVMLVLFDSRTGRKSNPIKVSLTSADMNDAGFTFSDGSYYPYMAWEIVYDTTKWDSVYWYRSARIENVGGELNSATLFLQKFDVLVTYHQGTQVGLAADHNRAVLYYYDNDSKIVLKDVNKDLTEFDADMPKGGAAEVHEGVLLMSKIKDTTATGYRSVGEIRWSGSAGQGLELFAPLAQHIPANAADDVIRFVSLGGLAIGLGRTKNYYVRRESIYMKVWDGHEGLVLVNDRAATKVSAACYFVTENGVKMLTVDGNLEDVEAVNDVILREWSGQMSDVHMSYDPVDNAIYILNADRRHVIILWLGTSMVSELLDVYCSAVSDGWMLQNPDDAASALERRSVWLGPENRVYISDARAQKTISGALSASHNGERRVSLFHPTGDLMLTVSAVAGAVFTMDSAKGVVGQRLVGSKLYRVSDGIDATIIGVNTGAFQVTLDAALSLAVGDVVVVSPVVFRWIGHQAGLIGPDGMEVAGDMMRVRRVDSIGVSLADVEGVWVDNATYDAWLKWAGTVHRMNTDDPEVRVVPTTVNNGTVKSLRDGESPDWAAYGKPHGVAGSTLYPGCEVLVVDTMFTLLEARVSGAILNTTRTARASS